MFYVLILFQLDGRSIYHNAANYLDEYILSLVVGTSAAPLAAVKPQSFGREWRLLRSLRRASSKKCEPI